MTQGASLGEEEGRREAGQMSSTCGSHYRPGN